MFATRLSLIKKYITHFLTARHTRGYGVHSPYLFHFTHFILYNKHWFYAFSTIEKCRAALKKDKQLIHVTDFGTGTDRFAKVSDIVSSSLQSPKYAQLFFRIINHYKMRNVLELGTSVGITTTYLATPSAKINCYTLEGSSEIANLAIRNFTSQGIQNVKIVVGDIDTTLDKVLVDLETVDFVCFDANHKYEAVMRYFNSCLAHVNPTTIFVFDDIYWSDGMEKAWTEIKNHPTVTSTIDLFQVGIVFFNPDLHKNHYKMRF